MQNVYVLEGARTAFTSFGGSFKNIGAIELGTATAKEAMVRAGVRAEAIDHVVYGNVIPSEVSSAYLSRHIGLYSGVPQQVPALTLNRLCGSGLQSVITASQSIMLNEAGIVLAGGTESMTQAPFSNFKQRFGGPKMGTLEFEDMLQATLTDQYTGQGMGMTAENLAQSHEITREDQDEYAVESNRRAARAREKGIFEKEIVPIQVKGRKGEQLVQDDEHIKADATSDRLKDLKPVFKKEGTVTAGNSSGINDGAASLVIAGEGAIERDGLTPLSRIVSWGISGVDPAVMGIGPVPAVQSALKRANLSIEEMDLVEVNEAFAAQYLAVEKVLGLDREKTNVNGGAIALGHPVGASGARILLSTAYELQRRNGKYAVVSLCIGGGQGIAMVIENV